MVIEIIKYPIGAVIIDSPWEDRVILKATKDTIHLISTLTGIAEPKKLINDSII